MKVYIVMLVLLLLLSIKLFCTVFCPLFAAIVTSYPSRLLPFSRLSFSFISTFLQVSVVRVLVTVEATYRLDTALIASFGEFFATLNTTTSKYRNVTSTRVRLTG